MTSFSCVQPRACALALMALMGGAAAGCTSTSGDDGAEPPGDAGPTGDGAPPPTGDGVTTLAGAAEPGYADGPREAVRFANPVNVAYGPDGRVYVADFDNGKLRAIDPATGATATVIAQPNFRRPFALAFAPDGALYATTDRDPQDQQDPMSGTLWRIDTGARTATPIAARLGRLRGLAVLPGGGRLVVTDYAHHVVELFDLTTGALLPLAGAWDARGMVDAAGAGARFSAPYGVAVVDGRIIVADLGNHRLRAVALDGRVTTYAGAGVPGFADGALTAARFNRPQGLAAAGVELFVTDLDNHRVRRVTGGAVDTIAGDGTAGFLDSADPLAARLYGLEGLSATPDGALVFVADGGRGDPVPYNRVRRVKLR